MFTITVTRPGEKAAELITASTGSECRGIVNFLVWDATAGKKWGSRIVVSTNGKPTMPIVPMMSIVVTDPATDN